MADDGATSNTLRGVALHELSIAGERPDAAGGTRGRAGAGETAEIVLGTGPPASPGAPHHRNSDEATHPPPGDPCPTAPTAPTETGAIS